jgi:hypothetical protein
MMLIEYQIIFYGFNFVVNILLILTYVLRLVDQIMDHSLLYVMWVVGLEVQIRTSIGRLPVHFCGQFWAPLHSQIIQEWKGIISLNFHSEFDGKPDVVDMVKKLL